MIQWVMAATLICGASVFTACTNDTGDNPSPEQPKKDRAEFIQHTRQNLKELAQNLNFESWNVANNINNNFNRYVLLNSDFEKIISATFIAQAQTTMKTVEEGSELAQMGYKSYGILDFTDFNYRFTINDEGTGFDAEPADDFEMIVHAFDPVSKEVLPKSMKVTLKAGGSSFLCLIKAFSTEDFAVVGKLPTEFEYAISSKASGDWSDVFWGSLNIDCQQSESSEYINRMTDAFNISGIVHSFLPSDTKNGLMGDATTVTFAIGQDPATKKASIQCELVQNGKDMIKLGGVIKNLNEQPIDFMQLIKAPSLIEAVVAMMAGVSVEEGTVTLLDDLTGSLKISNCAKAIQLVYDMSNARRNYANYQTIEDYTQQLNGLVSASITCKGVNQYIPMRLQTAKIGIDYWAVPAVNFADENGFVPITDMLDKESIEYMVNIADHAAVPMFKSLVTVNQLIRYIRILSGTVKEQQQKMQQQAQ